MIPILAAVVLLACPPIEGPLPILRSATGTALILRPMPDCKDRRLVLDSTGQAYSIACGCTEDDLQALIDLAEEAAGHTSSEATMQSVLAVYKSPSQVLREEADAIDARDAKIARLRGLIKKCRRAEPESKEKRPE